MEALATLMAPWSLEASGDGGRDMGILELLWAPWSASEGAVGKTHRHTGTLMCPEVWATSVDQGQLFRIGLWLVTRSRASYAVVAFLIEMFAPDGAHRAHQKLTTQGIQKPAELRGWGWLRGHSMCCESV